MKEYMELGPTPAGESCAQVGTDDYTEQARKEGAAYIAQLKRMFPNKPEGVSFVLKSFPHDYGSYYEVCVKFDDDYDTDVDFAYDVERNLPESWDQEARRELGL